jgi:predicted RNA-binding Zn ribbon-like protein
MLVSAVGADVCLGFVNTLSWRGGAAPVEALGDFAALLGWAKASAGLGAEAVRELHAWAQEHPAQAAAALAEAITLREAIYRIFSALAGGGPACDQDCAVLSGALAKAPARQRLVRSGDAYAWQIELAPIGREGLPGAAMLAPVLWSAADLLVGGGHSRVRRCANSKCLWLFRDESKTGTRRWCDMAACGNRAKARRHYLKTRRD